MQPSHIAIAVGTALLWGFGFVTSKYGADHMPPLFFLALRFTLMALMLVWFVRPPSGRWLAVSLFALTMGVGHFGLFYIALNIGVEASTAAIIWITQVPLSAILAGLLLRERPGLGGHPRHRHRLRRRRSAGGRAAPYRQCAGHRAHVRLQHRMGDRQRAGQAPHRYLAVCH